MGNNDWRTEHNVKSLLVWWTKTPLADIEHIDMAEKFQTTKFIHPFLSKLIYSWLLLYKMVSNVVLTKVNRDLSSIY